MLCIAFNFISTKNKTLRSEEEPTKGLKERTNKSFNDKSHEQRQTWTCFLPRPCTIILVHRCVDAWWVEKLFFDSRHILLVVLTFNKKRPQYFSRDANCFRLRDILTFFVTCFCCCCQIDKSDGNKKFSCAHGASLVNRFFVSLECFCLFSDSDPKFPLISRGVEFFCFGNIFVSFDAVFYSYGWCQNW